MKKRVGTMLLMVLMAIAISTQSFAAAPSTMSEERQAELKAVLRGIVANYVNGLGDATTGLLNSDFVRDMLKDAVKGLLNADGLLNLAGPGLGDLIGDALPGDLGPVIGDVLSNEDINKIIVQVLENKYFNIFLDKTIDNIFDDLDLTPFVGVLLDVVIDNATEKIWNNGNPQIFIGIGNFGYGAWNNSSNTWNSGGIASMLIVDVGEKLLTGNIEGLVDADSIDFVGMLSLFDLNLVLNAAKDALVETFDDFKEDFKAEIRARVEEKLAEIKDDIKAKLTARLIEELNDTFGTDFDSDATQEEMMVVLNPILDARAFENGDAWIAKLNGIKRIAGLLQADTDCIDQIIACIEARMDRQADLLSRTVTVNFPGVEGVTVQYSTNVAGWQTVGTFDETSTFVIPVEKLATFGVYTFRATKGGMSFSETVSALVAGEPVVMDVPVVKLDVYGISGGSGTLGVVGTNWVYQAVPHGGGQAGFNVFGGGSNHYTVRFNAAGFYMIERDALPYEEGEGFYAYFNEAYYQVTVPEGYSLVRMQSNNWIVNPAKAGDVIGLFQDYGNFQEAKMSFVLNGKAYSDVTFPLDGTDPFADICDLIGHDWDCWVYIDPTCVADGYWEQRCAHCGEIAGYWRNDDGTALGHDFGDFWDLDFSQSRLPHLPHANDPVGTCERCGWRGYVFAWEITEVEPTCVADGYTHYVARPIPNSGYDFEDWATAVYDEGSAFGHDFSSIVWDGFGWLASGCSRCDWEGYLSYDPFDPNFYTPEPLSDAEALLEFIAGGVTDLTNNLSVAGTVVTLFFGDDRTIVLSTNANNLNISGEVDLGDGFWLVFDIKGNGSNVKEFKMVQR